MSSSNKPNLYFGYGSNLWLHQMSTRCPESTYLGIARLPGYQWLINERGYANVVQVSSSSSSTSHVYGLVYGLSSTDEARLDKNEGVPVAYTKECLACDFWSFDSASSLSSSQSTTTTTTTGNSSNTSFPRKIDTSRPPDETAKPMLVYIDRLRTTPSVPRDEYVYRSIEDALRCGVPDDYVREVMRVYIPSDDDDDDDKDGQGEGKVGGSGNGNGNGREKLAEYAKQQAAAFKDESGVIE